MNNQISINGQFYAPMGRLVQMAILYAIFNSGTGLSALVDGGANGRLAGNIMSIYWK